MSIGEVQDQRSRTNIVTKPPGDRLGESKGACTQPLHSSCPMLPTICLESLTPKNAGHTAGGHLGRSDVSRFEAKTNFNHCSRTFAAERLLADINLTQSAHHLVPGGVQERNTFLDHCLSLVNRADDDLVEVRNMLHSLEVAVSILPRSAPLCHRAISHSVWHLSQSLTAHVELQPWTDAPGLLILSWSGR
jgi:hypothetical protein